MTKELHTVLDVDIFARGFVAHQSPFMQIIGLVQRNQLLPYYTKHVLSEYISVFNQSSVIIGGLAHTISNHDRNQMTDILNNKIDKSQVDRRDLTGNLSLVPRNIDMGGKYKYLEAADMVVGRTGLESYLVSNNEVLNSLAGTLAQAHIHILTGENFWQLAKAEGLS